MTLEKPAKLGVAARVESASKIYGEGDARVAAPFGTSGRVIWLGAPHGARVLYDARNDCYPADVARLGLAVELGGPPAEEVRQALRAAGTTHLLAFDGTPAARLPTRGWEAIARGEDLTLYRLPRYDARRDESTE